MVTTEKREHAIRPTDGKRRSPIVETLAFTSPSASSSGKRRLLTIPTYFVTWLLVTVLTPVWLPVGVIVGIVRRRSFIVLRMLTFLWVYLTIELVGVTLAGGIYLITPRSDPQKFEDRFFRLSCWWGTTIFRVICRLLSLSVRVEGDEHILPGPVLVFIRHASIIDVAVPVVYLSRPKGLRLRYVFKRELLVDPCVDIAGHAWPNYFIDRGGDPAIELEGIRRLADNLGEEGVLLYPEGTRFTELKKARALKRLREHHPDLVPIAESMTHCLPPKPGGALTLFEAAPHADLLVIVHRGLEGLGTVNDLLSGSVVGKEVLINIWRIPASEIPGPDQRLRWLFDLWKRVDAFVGEGG